MALATADERAARLPGAIPALALLLSMNLLNYVDRYVLAAVGPDIARDLLRSADVKSEFVRTKMGLLAMAFLLSYMVAAPVFGRLAERRSRWPLIAVGVILWSAASGASGMAVTFGLLLVTRCFVGVGEGAYGPLAPTLLADYYPVVRRGRVLAWFYAAIPVGSALGYVLGGQMATINPAMQSWRWAFFAVVIPGVLLGLWALKTAEPPRGVADRVAEPAHRVQWRDYLTLFRTPSYVLNTLGMTAMTFGMGALAWWMPDYLETHHVPNLWGIEPRSVLGGVTVLAGLLGTLAGGALGDALRGRVKGAYFVVSGIGLLAGVPCVLCFLALPFPLAWIFIFLAEFLLFFNTGPTNAILANVTHPSVRATGFAVNIFVIHLLGDAISPTIVGLVADLASLSTGFAMLAIALAVGGLFWLWGARYLDRDTEMAPQRLAE